MSESLGIIISRVNACRKTKSLKELAINLAYTSYNVGISHIIATYTHTVYIRTCSYISKVFHWLWGWFSEIEYTYVSYV